MAVARATCAVVAAVSIAAIFSFFLCINNRSKPKKKRRNGFIDAIGNTPLIRINSLSDATGCEIFGKAEFLNPGGSVKDGVAVKIIEVALESGELARGGVVTGGVLGAPLLVLLLCLLLLEANAMWLSQTILLLRNLKYLKPLELLLKGLGQYQLHTHRPLRQCCKEKGVGSKVASKLRNSTQTDAKDGDHVISYASEEGKQNSVFSSNYRGGFFADQFETWQTSGPTMRVLGPRSGNRLVVISMLSLQRPAQVHQGSQSRNRPV